MPTKTGHKLETKVQSYKKCHFNDIFCKMEVVCLSVILNKNNLKNNFTVKIAFDFIRKKEHAGFCVFAQIT